MKHIKNFITCAIIATAYLTSSCTQEIPAVEEPLPVINITVETTGDRGVLLRAEPANEEDTYFVNLIPSCQYTNDEDIKLLDMTAFAKEAEETGRSLQEVVESHLCTGSAEKSYDMLMPGECYLAYAYGLSADGTAKGTVSRESVTIADYGELHIGDYFMKDGSIAAREDIADLNKDDILGVIFYVGDPGAEGHDLTLKNEHPTCNRGLVVALDTIHAVWSMNASKFVNTWVEQDGRYLPIAGADGPDSNGDPTQTYNFVRGYNNTKAIEAYNLEASEKDHIQLINYIQAYRDSVALPFSTSGWYVPSVKEVSLMIDAGMEIADLWEIKLDDPVSPDGQNINQALRDAGGIPFEDFADYVSSTEHSAGMYFNIFYNKEHGLVGGQTKNDTYYKHFLRPVFAF